MQARKTARVPVPPRLTAEQAIPLIRGQIVRLDELLRVLYSDPRIGAWENATRDILDQAYGKPDGASHPKTTEMLNAAPGPLPKKTSPAESQGKHVMRCQSRKALLAAYIEELEFGIVQSQSTAATSNGAQAASVVYEPPSGGNGKLHEPASMEIAFREGLSRTTAAFWEQPPPPKSDAEFLKDFRKPVSVPAREFASAPLAEAPAAGDNAPKKAALGPNFLDQVDRVSAALARFGAPAIEMEAPPHEVALVPDFLESADHPSSGFLEDVEALEAVVAQSMSLAPSHQEAAVSVDEMEPAHAAPAADAVEPPPEVATGPAQVTESAVAGEPVETIASAIEHAAAEQTATESAPQLVESAAAVTNVPEAATDSTPETASEATVEAEAEPHAGELRLEDADETIAEQHSQEEAPSEVAGGSSSEAEPAPVEIAEEVSAEPAHVEIAEELSAEPAHVEIVEEVSAEPADAAVAMPMSVAIAEAAPEANAEAAAETIIDPRTDLQAPAADPSAHRAADDAAPAAAEGPAQPDAPHTEEPALETAETLAHAETPTPATSELSVPEQKQEPVLGMHVADAQPHVEESPAEEIPEFDRDPEFAAHLDSALGASASAEWAAFASEVELLPQETPAFAAKAGDIAAHTNGCGVADEPVLEQAALSDVCVHAVTDYECGDTDALTGAKSAWHPEIERVSGDLMRDCRWADAALAAYGRVVDEVRTRSRLPMDGDSLMNHAFGCDGKSPALAFNSLKTDAERDEQRGMMNLFKGAAGLRSARSYSDAIFGDSCKAREHLALASLLLRALDSSTSTV